jgi:peptidoglycan/LPS O-acetylase OafA/YrhL
MKLTGKINDVITTKTDGKKTRFQPSHLDNASALSSAQSCFLDWARGLAAQAVLVGHVISHNGIETTAYFQDLGVVIFFLLSGFLITGSVLRKTSAYDFVDFLTDRAARIFVPYFPAIVFIVVAGLLFNLEGPYDPLTVAGNVLLLQDFPVYRFIPGFPAIDRVGTGRPLWSVSVEWWLYMAFAAVAFFGRIPKAAIVLILIALYVIASQLANGTVTYMWLLGALFAVAWNRPSGASPNFWIVAAGVFLLLFVYRLRMAAWSFYDLRAGLLAGISFFSALKALQYGSAPSWLIKMGAGFAAFSYSLYLTHYTVMNAVPGWLAIPAANLVAIVMWALFERHHRVVARWLRSFRAIQHPQPSLPHSR